MQLKILILFLCSFPAAVSADDSEWQRTGPAGGMVMTLGAFSADGTVYLGTADGHVFASNDGATRWELRGRVGARTDAVISRLLADPTRPDVAYAAVWYQQPGTGGGVFRSEDAGRTWKLLGLAQEAVRALEVSKVQPLALLAGTRTGVFRSGDAGLAWERISPSGDQELRNIDSLAVDPRDADLIYAGTYHLPWKTIDGGKNWTTLATGLIDDSDIMSLRIDAINPDRLFLSACSGIYRSEDKGVQWTKLQGIPYAARRTHSILQDPQNPQTLYAGTTEGLWVTRDSGETWKRTTPGDWVVNSVLVLRSSSIGSGRVVLGTESQGIMVSDDAGENFTSSNEGFSHQVVKQFIGDPRDPKHLLIVTQQYEPRILESHDSGHSWIPLVIQAVSENRQRYQFAVDTVDKLYGTPWGWLARLRNGQLWIQNEKSGPWREWKLKFAANSAPPLRKTANNNRQVSIKAVGTFTAGPPLAYSQSNIYLFVQGGLLRCDQKGNCVALKAFGSLGNLKALHVSIDGSLLTLVVDSKLAISRDGGQSASWRDLPFAGAAVLWVDNAQESGMTSLFLGTTEGLYISADKGTNWARQQSGLPAGQIENWLRGTHFMAATLREGGSYVSSDEGKNWRRIDRDEERSRFVGLVETEPGILAIGSQSEGVFLWHYR